MISFSVNYKGIDYEVEGYWHKGSRATWGYYGGCPAEPAYFEPETIKPEPNFEWDMDEDFMSLLDERAGEVACGEREAQEDYYWEDR